MNIFVLDLDPKIAALYHCDEHVVKMITEYAQLMSSCQRLHGNDDSRLYRITHIHHPCLKWLDLSVENYRWLYALYEATAQQYNDRYGKHHAAFVLLKDVLSIPPVLPNVSRTPFAQAMPEIYRNEDPVKAYRDFYIGAKARFANWRAPASIPQWFKEGIPNVHHLIS